jgi:hypothetical protein
VQGEKSERQAVCLGARAREPGAVIAEKGRRKNERQVNPLDERLFEMLGDSLEAAGKKQRGRSAFRYT